MFSILRLCTLCTLVANQHHCKKTSEKMKQVCSSFTYLLVLFVLLVTVSVLVEAQKCKSSGKVEGKKPPKKECNQENGAERCEEDKLYTTYKCSQPVSALPVNSFEEGGDAVAPSECDGKYHDNYTPVVALSTAWFGKKETPHHITINGNGSLESFRHK
ncbi:kiwellin-1 [Populus trichocarpa]|nr:kiwellin-1 [Populus trichocarpa]